MYKKINPKQSFPELEKEIINFWDENKTFKKSIETRKDSEEFNFYDGPPFATGTPHYGHLLAGTIKDVIPRYQTMLGKRVDRVFGWDCHGLPIENIVEKKLEISGRDDIMKVGVHNFNEECRVNVDGYVDVWKQTVKRMGRWVDMENAYKTMDLGFMESVWWVYKSLYDKGLIYEGNRIVPYCPRCTTPLSNFEVNQGYKDKQDKTITVKFKVLNNENKYILAWTTTPWTLMSNLGLAVGENITYVEIKDKSSGETYILAKDRLKDYYKNDDDYSIIREYPGTCLQGIKYEPIFDDFKIKLEDLGEDLGSNIKLGKNAYSVVLGHHVTTESGTGIVHIAPAYGEDDFIIGEKNDLGFVAHIDDSGKVINTLSDNGKYVFDYNEEVIQNLKQRGDLVKISTIDHSYPHCWRCDTPLIYRGISAWYVAVEKIRDKMIKNNQKVNWVPEVIKNGRFGKWLEGARDWNISRNRYWGSAIPVWQSEDKKQEICVGSIEEFYELNKDFGDITKVIIVRHGRTDYNEKHLFDYQNKAKLNEVGKSQAEDLKKLLKNEKIDVIYSSPLSRCKDTIFPLAQDLGLEINEEKDLIEINAPELQNKEFSCKNFKWENSYGGGETIKEVYKRVTKAFKKIVDENKGKTIVIVTHGDPAVLIRKFIKDYDYDTEKYTKGGYLENNPEKGGIEKMFTVEYIYSNTYKQIDLHKHFVDEIFLENKNNFKAKNVLGIHGKGSDITKNSWEERKKIFKEKGMNLDLFQFDNSQDPTYKSWKETFDKIDFSKYDVIYTNSMGGAMTLNYIKEKNIKIKRLVATIPGKSKRYGTKERINVSKMYDDLYNENYNFSQNINDFVVIHAKDDETVPFENGKEFAEKFGANFIELAKGGHKLKEYFELIAGIVKNGTPLKRIPEVLDCWFESGAMPYASKHYPFAEKINTNIKKATTQEEFEKIDEFFAKMWKEEFGLDRAGKIEEYKKGRCFYLEENGEIISCLYSFESKKFGKEYIGRLGTKKEFRGQGLASDLLKILFTELYNTGHYEIALNAEIGNVEFYKYFGFKIKGEVEKLKENEDIESIYMEKKITKNDIYNFKFPADFIAEGLDQTRGWFYTLLILGTALFDNTPYLNVIVNGIILAEDGKKMSKSLKNYPDPNHILEKYGADALRFYLMNSPVVEAQEFRFSEAGVEEVVKKVILPLWNTFYFFTTYANIDKFEAKGLPNKLENPLDKWIISELNILTKQVRNGFDTYKLNNATRPIVKFMDNLTNWYIRRSRKRFWKTENDGDKLQAYETLNYVLTELTKIIAPFMPFISEYIYKELTKKESVHLDFFPEYDENKIDIKLNKNMDLVQKYISLGLAARANAKLRVRQPLNYVKIPEDLNDYYKEIIKEELNVKEIKIFEKEEMPKKICKPNGRLIGPKFGKDVKFIMGEAKAGNFEELENGSIKVGEFVLEPGEFEIVLEQNKDNKNNNEELESGFGTAVAINTELTPELIQEGIARDLIRQIQEARKQADYNVEDRININISPLSNSLSEKERISEILKNFGNYIESETLSKIIENLENPDLEKEIEIENLKINLTLKK